MKSNRSISFFAGLIGSAIVIALLVLILGLATFNLAGGETLNQTENEQTIYLFLSIILFLLAFAYAWRHSQRSKKFFSLGLLLTSFIAMTAVTIYVVKNQRTSRFDRKFGYGQTGNQQTWQKDW